MLMSTSLTELHGPIQPHLLNLVATNQGDTDTKLAMMRYIRVVWDLHADREKSSDGVVWVKSSNSREGARFCHTDVGHDHLQLFAYVHPQYGLAVAHATYGVC